MASVFGDDDEFAKVLKRAAKPAPSPVRKPTRGGGKAAQPKMYKVAASVTLSPEPGEEIPDDEVDLAVPTVVSQPPPVVAAAYKPPKVQAPKVSKFAPRTSPMNSAQQQAQLAQGDAAPEQPSHPTDPDPPSVVEDEAGEPIPAAVDITAPQPEAPKQTKPKKAKGKEREKPEVVSKKRLKKKAAGGGAPAAGTTEDFIVPAAVQHSSLHVADSDPATATLMHISETDFKVGEEGRSVAVPYPAARKTPSHAQATPELGVLGSQAARRLGKAAESTDTRLEETRAAASAPIVDATEAAPKEETEMMRPPSPPTASASDAPAHAALDSQRLSPERDVERAVVLDEQVNGASASEEGQSPGRDTGRMATPPTQLSPARPSPSPSKARATVTAARYQQRSSPPRRPTTAPTVYVRPGIAVPRIQVIRVPIPNGVS